MKTEEPDLDARDQFIICEGRFYAAMWFLRLPEQDNDLLRLGGDMNALLWRKDTEPEHWIFQWRFRYYKSREVWQSHDKKVWYCCEPNGPQEGVEATMDAMLALLAKSAGFPVEKLQINGDNNKFDAVVRKDQPSWMHKGVPDEVAAKGGSAERN